MPELKARFLECIPRTPSVESFRFKLPEKFDFLPGQFSQLMFDTAHRDNKELNKYLSFSCAPGKEYVEVTKRLSASIFSQKLKGLKPGDEVLFKTPLGTCVFKEGYKKIAFLIGGIGITPVISIIEYIVSGGLDTDVCLVYSNRTDEDIAFKKELDAWRSAHANIKVSYVVTECEPKDHTCIFGRIDKDLLEGHLCDMSERTIFIFGPPRMVEAMSNVCLEMGCAKENMKTENFIGY